MKLSSSKNSSFQGFVSQLGDVTSRMKVPPFLAGRKAERQARSARLKSSDSSFRSGAFAADDRGELGAQRSTRPSRARRQKEKLTDKYIFGTPARFMKPRLIFAFVALALTVFGLLMIYSASSITSQVSQSLNNDAMFYARRQVVFIIFGLFAAILLAKLDYRLWIQNNLAFHLLYALGLLLLFAIKFTGAGQDAYGAERWITIFGFTLQPSEFAKILIIFGLIRICWMYYDLGVLEIRELAYRFLGYCGLPLFLILWQPDKGTTMIVGVTILIVAYLAGIDRRYIVGVLLLGFVAMLLLSLKDEYSRARLITMLNPWNDYYGKGYQLIQGFYAFGSGGIFGVGIGLSHQKYAYLPFAHNDFIFAIIGEETGLIGTVAVIVAFIVLVRMAFKIAQHASDNTGRLLAASLSSMLLIQLFLNIAGVLGWFPLSGKPIPFLSYGGSSIIASLMIVGLILSVSIHSELPETAHDRNRRDLRQLDSSRTHEEASWVGEPSFRSARRPSLRVMEGGPKAPSSPLAQSRKNSSARTRINLGPSAADRLRPRGNKD